MDGNEQYKEFRVTLRLRVPLCDKIGERRAVAVVTDAIFDNTPIGWDVMVTDCQEVPRDIMTAADRW